MNDCSICKNYEPVTAKAVGQKAAKENSDVVQVVRCKDCKHRDANDMCFMHHDYGEFVYLDGYCNYAEEV